MKLNKFIEENALFSNSLISINEVKKVESIIGMKVGQQLKEYMVNYGYLIYEGIELYGITARQEVEDSDIVKQTLYLHKYFPSTKGYIAIENQGDGDYYLVDSRDTVYEFISEEGKLKSTGLKLFNYITQRFDDEL